MAKKLMKGTEAIGEASVQAGCHLFFGYPITPQNEIPEYLSHRLPEVGGAFVQAESEVAASNMLYGASGAGARCFSSSSSPGISLMSEAISYMAGSELPVVLVNIVRCGPGLGGILPSQGDYMQATRGGGHGDYKLLVLAPWSVQEAADLVMEAFDLADYYRNPVMIVGDGVIGQMMEPVEFKKREAPVRPLAAKDWATTGCKGRAPNIINSLYLDPDLLEALNQRLQAKYREMEEKEIRFAEYGMDRDIDVLLIAYGTVARVALTALEQLDEEGIRLGIFRPVSLFPFPAAALRARAARTRKILVAELSTGQMIEDVRLALGSETPLTFHGRQGGNLITVEDFVSIVKGMVGQGRTS